MNRKDTEKDGKRHGKRHREVHTLKSTRFRFLESGIDPISARAADLLACPPHLLHKHCISCSYHTSPTLQPLGEDARHFVRCPKGLRLHTTVSDRVRDELAYILERCNIRIVAHRQRRYGDAARARRRESWSNQKDERWARRRGAHGSDGD